MSGDNGPLSDLMNQMQSQMAALQQQLTDTQAELAAFKATRSTSPRLRQNWDLNEKRDRAS